MQSKTKTKLLFFLILTIFLFFIFPTKIFSQYTPFEEILKCGNAEASDSAYKKCCISENINITDPFQPISPYISLLEKIPFLGGMALKQILSLKDATIDLQKKTPLIPCYIGYPSTSNYKDPNCICLLSSEITPTPYKSIQKMCQKYLQTTKEYESCQNCANEAGVWTALGCFHGNLSNFIIKDVFGKGIALGGIIALFCILYSSFLIQTSQGNPEKIKKAQELLTSCVMGLLVIIFSVLILKIIGVDILKIPGLGKS